MFIGTLESEPGYCVAFTFIPWNVSSLRGTDSLQSLWQTHTLQQTWKTPQGVVSWKTCLFRGLPFNFSPHPAPGSTPIYLFIIFCIIKHPWTQILKAFGRYMFLKVERPSNFLVRFVPKCRMIFVIFLDNIYSSGMYLAASGLRRIMWDLSVWCLDSSCDTHRERGLSCSGVWVILAPHPRIEPASPVSQGWFLTTRPFGKSHGFCDCHGNSIFSSLLLLCRKATDVCGFSLFRYLTELSY